MDGWMDGCGWWGEFMDEYEARTKLTRVSKFLDMFQKRECCVISASSLE